MLSGYVEGRVRAYRTLEFAEVDIVIVRLWDADGHE